MDVTRCITSLASFLFLVSPSVTDGRIVSASDVVDPLTSATFAHHFPPTAKVEDGEQAKVQLFNQEPYNSKLHICHRCSDLLGGEGRCTDQVGTCRFATVYDENENIPLLSVKKYEYKDVNTWIKDLKRQEWDFNENLGVDAGRKRTWPKLEEACYKTFYDVPPVPVTEGTIHRGHLLGARLAAGPAPAQEPVYDAKSTFSLYNIVPQFGHTNTGHWGSQVEDPAKGAILDCFRKEAAAFYLIAGVHDFQSNVYKCSDCEGTTNWQFGGRVHMTQDKCCKVTNRLTATEIAFPGIMWIAGCCTYTAKEKDENNNEREIEKVEEYYGRSLNLNKQQKDDNTNKEQIKGNLKKVVWDESILSQTGIQKPFKDSICDVQPPQGKMGEVIEEEKRLQDLESNCKRRRTKRSAECVNCKSCSIVDLVIEKGKSLTLRCIATAGRPRPEVKWTKSVRGETETVGRSEVLEINDVKETHKGEYFCKLENAYGYVQGGVKLDVGVKPRIVLVSEHQLVGTMPYQLYLKKGRSADVKCEATDGNPEPTVEWNPAGTATRKVDEGGVILSLSTETSEGTYTCTGQNEFGSDRKELEVVVSVDGGWSAWESTIKCSVQCGGGTHLRVRQCDNPAPRNRGSPCKGESERSNTCNARPCDDYDVGFRMLHELFALIGAAFTAVFGVLLMAVATVFGSISALGNVLGVAAPAIIDGVASFTPLLALDQNSSCPDITCPAGSYADGKCRVCAPCIAHTYQPLPNTRYCMVCPAGMYQPLPAQAACVPCPADTTEPICTYTRPLRLLHPNRNTSEVQHFDGEAWTTTPDHANLTDHHASILCRLFGYAGGAKDKQPYKFLSQRAPNFTVECDKGSWSDWTDYGDCVGDAQSRSRVCSTMAGCSGEASQTRQCTVCPAELDVGYDGYDLLDGFSEGLSASGCRDACLVDTRCKAFSYYYPTYWLKGKYCFLKYATGKRIEYSPHTVAAENCDDRLSFPVAEPGTCSTELGADYSGNDLPDGFSSGSTASVCRDACLSDVMCKAFTYNYPTKHCFLKSAAGNRNVDNTENVAGICN